MKRLFFFFLRLWMQQNFQSSLYDELLSVYTNTFSPKVRRSGGVEESGAEDKEDDEEDDEDDEDEEDEEDDEEDDEEENNEAFLGRDSQQSEFVHTKFSSHSVSFIAA